MVGLIVGSMVGARISAYVQHCSKGLHWFSLMHVIGLTMDIHRSATSEAQSCVKNLQTTEWQCVAETGSVKSMKIVRYCCSRGCLFVA